MNKATEDAAKKAVGDFLKDRLTTDDLKTASNLIAKFMVAAVQRDRQNMIQAQKAIDTADPISAMFRGMGGMRGR
jgi:hypothetical protein